MNLKYFARFIKKLFSEKIEKSGITLLVFDKSKDYDNGITKESNCKHKWFVYESTLSFAGTGLDLIPDGHFEKRICEKCFLWESRQPKYKQNFSYFGYGEEAFNELYSRKINS